MLADSPGRRGCQLKTWSGPGVSHPGEAGLARLSRSYRAGCRSLRRWRYFVVFASAGAASGDHTQMAWEVANIETMVAALRARGVVFEEYELPGLKTVNGIANIEGNYPSKGVGEKGAWFRDSEGNLLGLGRAVRR